MKILQIHNQYTQSGGEDIVTKSELQLLHSHEHEIFKLQTSNSDIIAGGLFNTCRTLLVSAWNRGFYENTCEIIRKFKPDIIHVHNFWFALSPSVFGAAQKEKVPVVMTLHNYRLICSGALLMQKGKICEKCIGKSAWLSVPYACYRNSMLQTAAVSRMIEFNRRNGTWNNLVDSYIALTEFSRRKFIQGGLPAEKIFVKPNFIINDPGTSNEDGFGAVFVGRLSREKGVHILLETWKNIPREILTIIGKGPEKPNLENRISDLMKITFTGNLDHTEVMNKIKQAEFLVVPSLWYEGSPIVLLEAYACGRPVIASRLGAMAELVKDGETGLLFEPGNANDLTAKVKFLLDNPDECKRMGKEARREFEEKYNAEKNYQLLMEIYKQVIENYHKS